MRTARPTLVLSEAPSYSTPFFHDPWPLEGCSPHSDDTSSGEHRFSGDSNRSSRTSSSHSHVLPESAFLNSNNDGTYIVDPWFGQKDLALLCSKYLNRAFNSVEETESSKRLGQPRLSIFIAQLMHITGVPLKVIGASLILLQRYFTIISQQSHNHHCLSGHRLFIGALMLACSDDNLQSMSLGRENARSAAYWSDISLFPEHELDEVFNEMYDELDGNIVVFPSYAAALEKLNNPVSIKSFEGDLGAFVSADYDVDDSEAGVSESSLSLHEVDVSEKKTKQQQKKQRKNDLEASLRTRIFSLFTGRKSKS